MRRDVTGLILAGGRSRRFGSDKALAEVGGEPMIARVYRALAPCCAEVIVSVGVSDVTYPLPGPSRFVADCMPDAGPLSGLEAGLAHAETSWLLAVACDLPHLTPTVLRALLNARTDVVDAVVGMTPDARWQPLCACYTLRVLPLVREHLGQGLYAMHTFLDRLAVHTVPVPANALRNFNLPGDLDGVRR